ADTPLLLLTEEAPPYNMIREGKLTGISVDVVREILRRVGGDERIEIHTWAISYRKASQEKGRGLFSTTRTAEREPLFKWVGPLVEDDVALYARIGARFPLATLDDARAVGAIGVYRDDAGEAFLKGKGFTNLDVVAESRQNARKLAAGRIDLWIENRLVGDAIARAEGLAGRIEPRLVVERQLLYLAFSRDVPDETVARWQGALNAMKADGAYGAILSRYLQGGAKP
ncbi:MAG: transporter substrate-binding domain-containing protein, partial [Nitrospinae bacterium]|nr:transporter substrate-binding domain-containing protein [Nitrospinota bacterium]